MNSCRSIYNQYKRNSKIIENGYIDSEGYRYDTRSIVACYNCMFHIYHDSCILYWELGFSEQEMKNQYRNVYASRYCDYFLKKSFSEGDSEDEKVRDRVMAIAKKQNYPTEYWQRVSLCSSSSSSEESSSNWLWWVVVIGGILWLLSN